MNIEQLTVHEYLEKLAAPSFPGPTIGSAAASVAGTAAALVEMSCAITIKKDAQQCNLAAILKEMNAVRKDCLFRASEDIMAYARVINATKSKKEFPDQYETAMKEATETLVPIVKNCARILSAINQVIDTCFIKVWGDLAGAASITEAAAAAAKQGIDINLRLLQDENFIETIQHIVNESYNNCLETKERILVPRTGTPVRDASPMTSNQYSFPGTLLRGK